eukprot:TRINITY_DN3678_c0_g1_i1.p1 TRINITY_DN3678_c0_g1~~TRINITY_DN3678_c0_g1_i1.p1  ORF type:complete len:75 (-),score=27.66 TRINITY_DN3678_c0_g1_i1:60-284(-)
MDKAHGGYDSGHFTQQMVSDDDSSSDEVDPMVMAKTMSVEQLQRLHQIILKGTYKRRKKEKKRKRKKKKEKRKK